MESEFIFCLEYLLISYFNIVRKNIRDTVIKSVMHFLVNKSKETIQNELVACLYKEELFPELLTESSVVAQRRDTCKGMIDMLKRAHEILNEVRDHQIH
jgi:dynamin 1-like protein